MMRKLGNVIPPDLIAAETLTPPRRRPPCTETLRTEVLMKKIALLLMLLALAPVRAGALNTNDLLSLVAMPLAVDGVSRVTGVPQDQLAQFVSTLNQANVPPTQFVQTVRYAPVALQQPDFVPYVETQRAQGITGVQLVDVIDQRLPQYGVTMQPVEYVDAT